MWHVIFALAYIIAIVEPSLLPKSISLGADEVDLGSYNAKVHIGKLPALYNLTDEDKRAGARAGEMLEQLRTLFPTGILTIPPLDPYKNNKLDPIIITAEDSPLLTGKINIHEVVVKGGKSFNLKSLEIRLKNNLRADFDVKIPSLHGHVAFNADLLLGNIIPMALKGKVNFNIKEISGKGAVGAEKNTHGGNEVYQIQNLQANFHAEEIHISLRGLGRRLIQDVLKFFKNTNLNTPAHESTRNLINNSVAKIGMEEVNKILQGFTTQQVQAFLYS